MRDEELFIWIAALVAEVLCCTLLSVYRHRWSQWFDRPWVPPCEKLIRLSRRSWRWARWCPRLVHWEALEESLRPRRRYMYEFPEGGCMPVLINTGHGLAYYAPPYNPTPIFDGYEDDEG